MADQITDPTGATSGRSGPAVVSARWLHLGPCPEWCEATKLHSDDDHDDDRTHSGFDRSLFLTLSDPFPHGSEGPMAEQGMRLDVSLWQHYQEAAPRVWLGIDGSNRGLYLSLDEAEWLADQLKGRIMAARGEDDPQ